MEKSMYPCLWFDGDVKEAARYYSGILKGAKITTENQFVSMIEWNNTRLMCLNGNANSTFNESVSLVIECDTQAEIDHYWNNFTANGGEESMCGWCKDKYGISWQIVPAKLGQWMSDPEKFPRMMQEVMKMKKLDIAIMEKA